MTEFSNTYAISDISAVLKRLMAKYDNFSGSELAKKTGLPISTVNRILAGTVSDPRVSTLKPLANYFGITVDQLLGYTALPEKYSNKNINLQPSTVIPVLSLKKFSNTVCEKPKEWFTWVTQKPDTYETVFALAVDTKELEPVFEKDTVLIIEPHMLPPQNGDYVAIQFEHDSYLSIKRYLIDGSDHYFLPMNSKLKALDINERPYKMIGIVSEAHTKMRG